MIKALIFIPGIKGTKLYDVNTPKGDILWQDIRFNFEKFENLTLSFSENGQFFDEKFDSLVEPLHLEPIAYNQFWKNLKPDYKWKFIFPYDWRLPNKENGKRLAEFMKFIIEKSKVLEKQNVDGVKTITSFDFVTHSMGNMPLRNYIHENGFKLINKIVFVAPPFRGSLDAVSALAVGQGFFFNKEETRKMARTLPALLELLPRYKGNNIDEVNQELDMLISQNWQKNITNPREKHKIRNSKKFIENLKSAKQSLEELEYWKDSLTENEKKRIIILAKTDEKTLTSLPIIRNPESDNQPKNLFDFRNCLHTEAGDGVVTDESSCYYYKEFATYVIFDEFFRDDKKHAFLMRDNRVQRIVNSFLKADGEIKTDDLIIGGSVKKVKGFKTYTHNRFTYRKADV